MKRRKTVVFYMPRPNDGLPEKQYIASSISATLDAYDWPKLSLTKTSNRLSDMT